MTGKKGSLRSFALVRKVRRNVGAYLTATGYIAKFLCNSKRNTMISVNVIGKSQEEILSSICPDKDFQPVSVAVLSVTAWKKCFFLELLIVFLRFVFCHQMSTQNFKIHTFFISFSATKWALQIFKKAIFSLFSFKSKTSPWYAWCPHILFFTKTSSLETKHCLVTV